MKAVRVFLPIALILLLLSACGPGDVSETGPVSAPVLSPAETQTAGELTLPYFAMAGLNPYTCQNSANTVFFPLIWEGLFSLDAAFTPSPLLCERYTVSDDGLTYSLILRSGVTFSDGTALSAADVADSLNAARGEGSRYKARLSGIAQVRADGEQVTITLSAPNGGLPALLDLPIVKSGSLEGKPVGTGPYVFAQSGETASLTARDDWWQGLALPLKTVYLSAVTVPDQLVSGLKTHGLDLVTNDFNSAASLGYSGDYQVWDYPTANLIYLGCNTQSGPLKDAALRRALASGMDRDSILGACFFRHGQAAALPVPPGSPYYDAQVAKTLDYSPQNMVDLLEKAGYIKSGSHGGETIRTSVSLRLLACSDSAGKTQAADWIAQSLAVYGISVTVKKLAWEDYTAALQSGSFDLYLAETRLTADFDLTELLSSSGALNYGGYRNEKADSLLSDWKAAPGQQRVAKASSLFGYLTNQSPIIPLLFKSDSVLTHRNALAGLNPTSGNVFYQLDKWMVYQVPKA